MNRINIKIIVLIILALALWYFVSLTAAFFWTIFVGFAIFKLDSTIVAQAALVCLVMLPILLATGKDGVAEQVAVYAYFLLAMTVGLQIIELKRNPEEPSESTSLQSVIPMLKVKLKKSISDVKPLPKREKRIIEAQEIKKK